MTTNPAFIKAQIIFFSVLTLFLYLFWTTGDPAKNNTVRVFVECFDKLGASVSVESTVTVNPKQLSKSDLDDLITSGEELKEGGNVDDQLSM